jgi:hypothetical protein
MAVSTCRSNQSDERACSSQPIYRQGASRTVREAPCFRYCQRCSDFIAPLHSRECFLRTRNATSTTAFYLSNETRMSAPVPVYVTVTGSPALIEKLYRAISACSGWHLTDPDTGRSQNPGHHQGQRSVAQNWNTSTRAGCSLHRPYSPHHRLGDALGHVDPVSRIDTRGCSRSSVPEHPALQTLR